MNPLQDGLKQVAGDGDRVLLVTCAPFLLPPHQPMDVNKTKIVGAASADFDGAEQLVIEVRPTGDKAAVRGMLAALAKATDAPAELPRARTPRFLAA